MVLVIMILTISLIILLLIIGLTNILFIDEYMAVQIIFLDLLYGITHGFDITLDLLFMALNFKDILRFVFFFRIV